jgi:hypothetical protein
MRRLLLALALVALPAHATITNCTTQMVNGGFCASTNDILVHYAITNGVQARILDNLALAMNYQANVPCAEVRVEDALGVLQIAGFGDGTCAVGTNGQQVANPQSKRNAADKWIRRLILADVARAETAAQHAATDASIQATPTPVVGP